MAAVTVVVAACGGNEASTTTITTDAPTTITSTTAATSTTTTSAVTTTSTTPAAPSSEEFRFASDGFELAGTLHLPGGEGPHGGLIMVSGSGPQTRDSTPTSGLVRDRFIEAGYAVLSWDKPGSGESTGEFDSGLVITERAGILADAIARLGEHPSVDSDRIGLWGLSQAGWVMPLALTMTDGVAFMIVVNGGGEDGIEQMVYQWTQRARCGGATEAELALMDEHGAPALKAATYDEYRAAMERLLTIPGLSLYVGVEIELVAEDRWQPWPRDIDAFFDPMEVIGQTTIPVLAIFGEQDVQVDPLQGAEAYRAALALAGNTDSHVELIPGVGHTLTPSADGCATGGTAASSRYLELLDEWIVRLQAG